MTNRVEGVFEDRRRLTQAVRRLAEKSVPADAVRVFIVDPDGNHRRAVEVDDEAGTWTGALIGAAVGAVVGLIVFIPVSVGVFGRGGAEGDGLQVIAGGLAMMTVLAVVCAPLGALIGMGRWQGRKQISDGEFAGRHALLVVESVALAALAQEVLEEAGAIRVTSS